MAAKLSRLSFIDALLNRPGFAAQQNTGADPLEVGVGPTLGRPFRATGNRRPNVGARSRHAARPVGATAARR
jgi:hypothetical protein